MNGPNRDELLAAGLKRPWTNEEEAQLASLSPSDAEEKARLQEESNLNRLIRELPSPAVSSNFTAQVLQAATAQPPRPRPWGWALPMRRWLPATAGLAAIFLAGIFVQTQIQLAHRQNSAKQLATFSQTAPMPALELLQDFDAIHNLSQAPRQNEDDRVLAALQ